MPDFTPDNPNPYQPPESPTAPMQDTQTAAGQPSSMPKVFGILSIIFASLVLVFGLMYVAFGVIFNVAEFMSQTVPPDSPNSAEMKNTFGLMGDMYRGMGYQGVVWVVMSTMLLIVGIGQLRYRRWAARWSVIWGALALVSLVIISAIAVLIIGPAYQRFFEAMNTMTKGGGSASPGFNIGPVFGVATAISNLIFYAPYPIVLLVVFSQKKNRALMQE